MTNLFEVVFLGLVQGLTEFLPISSSAHLRIVGEFLPNAKDPGAAFTAITQIGTELAVLIYFRREILSIVRNWTAFNILRKRNLNSEARADNKMGWMIIIGSIPIFCLGFLFQDSIKTTFRSLTLVALMLIIFGLILGLADYVGDNQKGSRDLNVKEALMLGFAQSLALIPGVSRSGATIAAGRLLGFNRSAATKFSFFLAIPAVLGSGLYQLYQVISDPTTEVYSLGETFIATTIAFAVGYAVIAWLMKYISKKSFQPFVIYRLILGSAILIAVATNFLN
ncbi:MAG: undecaprenyl-diphosphate phosphatase [Candidatus Nanopelagicaceae bacterium]|nr:undecaprenyl-diphosphate phosphatase [Candidatus Nanopelagicaceae bacterium]